MSENESVKIKIIDEDAVEGEETASEEEIAEEETSLEETGEDEKNSIVKELEEKLEAAEQESKEHQDRLVRLYAEFENYKKRTLREMSEFRKFANESLIRELLPVIDNLERAVEHSVNNTENGECGITKGVDLTLKEILRIFDKFNVKPVEALGHPFDPNFHEAVGQEERDDCEDNIVVREFQKGYVLHDRLVRPAMVIVSKAKVIKDEIEEDNDPADENAGDEQTEQE